jgi:peroxiredoxin
MTGTYEQLPDELPVPVDDGATAHLVGLAVPPVRLAGTDGTTVDLAESAARPDSRTVLFIYPMTGRPGVPLPDGWDDIPGARGCTPESIGFRDHHGELVALGVAVYGLSSQSTAYQAELAERIELPFPLLSDESFELAGALDLPTFQANGVRLYKRVTLILRDGHIERVFYPIFPPDVHAAAVTDWIRSNPGG